ncbi:MAG: 30S ribosomal protein S15 [Phycisphaerales bacterium]|nr:30S ribosomal protein S15 [Phycisphaerales bacterium]
MISVEKRKQAITAFARTPEDTGSPEVQISILTARIKEVAEHLRGHKLDYHNKRGLVMMVGKRNRLLKYLSRTNPERYQSVIKALGLRK